MPRIERNGRPPTLLVIVTLGPALDQIARPGGRGNKNTVRVMVEAEFLSTLVGDIYDATLDPGLWPNVLRDIAGFVGGPAAALFSKSADDRSGDIYYDSGGIDRRYIRLYFDKCFKLEPSTTDHFFAEVAQPIATADLIPYDKFLATRFYREWAQPQGLVDFVAAVLDKTATTVAMFGVFRHQRDGIVDDDARRRMRLVVPHVRRAVLIGKTVDLKAAETATFADTFDGVAAGMFLVDTIGRIVHANAAGHAILADGDFLAAIGDRLVASDGDADRQLRDVFSAAGSGAVGGSITGIAVPLIACDGARHVARVLPLTSRARRRAGGAHAAVAAVFVHKAALDIPSSLEVIAKSHGLTPTELRVLLAVVEVGGVPEVAETLGVADSTVKTHLRRLYEKTGARRHADLVKIVVEFSNPLVG